MKRYDDVPYSFTVCVENNTSLDYLALRNPYYKKAKLNNRVTIIKGLKNCPFTPSYSSNVEPLLPINKRNLLSLHKSLTNLGYISGIEGVVNSKGDVDLSKTDKLRAALNRFRDDYKEKFSVSLPSDSFLWTKEDRKAMNRLLKTSHVFSNELSELEKLKKDRYNRDPDAVIMTGDGISANGGYMSVAEKEFLNISKANVLRIQKKLLRLGYDVSNVAGDLDGQFGKKMGRCVSLFEIGYNKSRSDDGTLPALNTTISSPAYTNNGNQKALRVTLELEHAMDTMLSRSDKLVKK